MARPGIVTISRAALEVPDDLPPAKITAPRYASSYNWIDTPQPTIAVPGCPPLWSPPTISRRLHTDSGLIYISQNAARLPQSPLEPLFRALLTSHPSFDLSSLDVVTDRNNIRKLLAFVGVAAQGGHTHDSFTIKAEVVQDTLILCRTETVAQEFLGPNDFRGFGHEYEKTYTTSQVTDSSGHYRIIEYKFCGLNFLLRHETDGCVSMPEEDDQPSGLSHLSDQLQSMSLHPAGDAKEPPNASGLNLKRQGRQVAFDSILEIKTRSSRRHLALDDVAPQLWASQTSKLVRAYHLGGKFNVPVVEDVSAQLRDWETNNKSSLEMLSVLLRKLRCVTKDFGGAALIKYDAEQDRLVIQQSSKQKLLPMDLYAKWEGSGASLAHNQRSFLR